MFHVFVTNVCNTFFLYSKSGFRVYYVYYTGIYMSWFTLYSKLTYRFDNINPN